MAAERRSAKHAAKLRHTHTRTRAQGFTATRHLHSPAAGTLGLGAARRHEKRRQENGRYLNPHSKFMDPLKRESSGSRRAGRRASNPLGGQQGHHGRHGAAGLPPPSPFPRSRSDARTSSRYWQSQLAPTADKQSTAGREVGGGGRPVTSGPVGMMRRRALRRGPRGLVMPGHARVVAPRDREAVQRKGRTGTPLRHSTGKSLAADTIAFETTATTTATALGWALGWAARRTTGPGRSKAHAL